MPSNPTCAIVSPYQGTPLNDVSRLSFERTASVLSRHRWILALPEGTDLAPFKEIRHDIEARFFPPRYFASKRAAQHFYMHPDFYDAFSDFDFILIHQPDVYVFDDQLDYWIGFMSENKYDYIGAPWWDHEWLKFARNPIARLPWHWMLNQKVGSGGFSIRNPKRLSEIAKEHMTLIRYLARFVPEDIWWCQIARLCGSPLHIPSPEDAARFCVETQCARGIALGNGTSPFAVHGWNRHDWDFWRGRIPGVEAIYDDLAKNGVRPI